MNEVSLSFPGLFPVSDKQKTEQLIKGIELFTELYNRICNNERVYFKYITGELAGSIFFVEFDDDYNQQLPTPFKNARKRTSMFSRDELQYDYSYNLFVRARWEGRRNNRKESIRFSEDRIVYLRDYDGPTVWNQYNVKKHAEMVLKTHDVTDRYGNKIEVGASVTYINARYNTGSRLDRGVVTDIAAKSRKIKDVIYTDIHVLIERNGDRQQSKIAKYNEMIIVD